MYGLDFFSGFGRWAPALAALGLLHCSGGEIHLPGPGNSGENTPPLSAGAEGGASSDGTGGSATSTGSTSGSPGDSSGATEVPCSFSGDCFSECASDPDQCACETNGDCGGRVPLCSGLGSCVECLEGAECVERFGESFSTCSDGRCKQCDSNDDCDGNVACVDGWCGTCETDADCFGPTVCNQGHCLASDFPG